jgi:putative ABC transport system ATP-binding protein
LPNDAEAVRFERIVRTYRTPSGEVQALREVSGSFPHGIVTAVVGPSGSGKSSLLRLIAGMDSPTSGSLVVEGRDVGRGSARARRLLRRELVGYVYQRPSDNFVPHLTVGEHLRLAAGHRDRDGADARGLLELLGIGHRIGHLPSEISGGEQQRAAFAQALASGANIIVADEPTAELDTTSSTDVLERVRALTREGVTFVLATHDPAVIGLADERLELEHGRVRDAVRRDEHERGTGAPLSLRWQDPGIPSWLVDPEPVLQLSGVQKTYGHGDEVVHALRDVSLRADAGEVVGLVGRSGSGKTTLLNIAAGWEEPDSGQVVCPGGHDPAWSEVAVLPQRLGLMEELSVEENVEYPARSVGALDVRRELVDDLIEALGLSALRARYPRETSLGEQQRTALARALILGPKLLLADEPTGHQDAGWAARIMRILRDAAGAGCCCVIATHDRALIDHLDRSFEMSDGSVSEQPVDGPFPTS